jgi:hypothetical protein
MSTSGISDDMKNETDEQQQREKESRRRFEIAFSKNTEEFFTIFDAEIQRLADEGFEPSHTRVLANLVRDGALYRRIRSGVRGKMSVPDAIEGTIPPMNEYLIKRFHGKSAAEALDVGLVSIQDLAMIYESCAAFMRGVQ